MTTRPEPSESGPHPVRESVRDPALSSTHGPALPPAPDPAPDPAPHPAPIPVGLTAIGADGASFVRALRVDGLPPSALRRVTFGDLDVLLAHTSLGIVAVDDRCPHMSAPLSLGALDGCVVACPLHDGRFDLATGDPVQMPTTGGLDPDGVYHPTWSPTGGEPKVDPPGLKAEARRLTRVRRFRYYPVRIVDGFIEVAVPLAPA